MLCCTLQHSEGSNLNLFVNKNKVFNKVKKNALLESEYGDKYYKQEKTVSLAESEGEKVHTDSVNINVLEPEVVDEMLAC